MATAEEPPPYHPSAVKQWVSKVTGFSSQYNSTTWGADQVIGHPKIYPAHGDMYGAWASSKIDKHQFIQLEFDVAVFPTSVNIYETFNAGGVVAVKAMEPPGVWTTLWSVSRPSCQRHSRIFSPPLQKTKTTTKHIRLEVDCTAAGTWCEIDAVELVGIREGAVALVDDTAFFKSMESLVNSKDFSDIKFEIDGKKLFAHKAILASRSTYFMKLFKSNDEKVKLTLPDVSFNDLLTAISFIYTNRLPPNYQLTPMAIANLCKAASHFDVPDLMSAAAYSFVGKLSCSNVVDTYLMVENFPNIENLKSICLTFMADNLKEMSNEPSFQKMPQNALLLVVQEATAKMCVNGSVN